jgi:hypothetical protein
VFKNSRYLGYFKNIFLKGGFFIKKYLETIWLVAIEFTDRRLNLKYDSVLICVSHLFRDDVNTVDRMRGSRLLP